MDSYEPKFEKMNSIQRLTSYGKKYLYSVEYYVHTVKEGREDTLTKNVTIPYDNIADPDKLRYDMHNLFKYEMNHDVYDNYDVAFLMNYKVVTVYDRDLE